MPRKRHFGYLLLTLLVISGLAGTPTNNSLSIKERKYVTELLKDTKSNVVNAVKGLTEAQLNFKAGPDIWSIKECIYHIAISEKKLWGLMETSLKGAANPEKRAEIKMTDDQLLKMLEDRSFKVKMSESFEPKKSPYKTNEEAIEDFKMTRANHIKYLKATTEELRNHVIQMPFGWLDCYQLCLMIGAQSNRHTQQINEVKANPRYPN